MMLHISRVLVTEQINEVTVEFDHNSSGKLAVLSDTIKYVQLVGKKKSRLVCNTVVRPQPFVDLSSLEGRFRKLDFKTS